MKLLDKISRFNTKIGIISTFIILLTGAGLVPLIQGTTYKIKEVRYILDDYPKLRTEFDSLELRTKIIEKQLEDYDLIKEHVIYLMKDNEVLSGLLSANMKKINDKDYGTVVEMYNSNKKEYCKQLVEVKIRQSVLSGDLYVFVPWGETEFGVPMIKKFVIKWHEDDEKYFFIDKSGAFYLLYEIDISKTIRF